MTNIMEYLNKARDSNRIVTLIWTEASLNKICLRSFRVTKMAKFHIIFIICLLFVDLHCNTVRWNKYLDSRKKCNNLHYWINNNVRSSQYIGGTIINEAITEKWISETHKLFMHEIRKRVTREIFGYLKRTLSTIYKDHLLHSFLLIMEFYRSSLSFATIVNILCTYFCWCNVLYRKKLNTFIPTLIYLLFYLVVECI